MVTFPVAGVKRLALRRVRFNFGAMRSRSFFNLREAAARNLVQKQEVRQPYSPKMTTFYHRLPEVF
jgi:hypothetical protein